jgi:hypothetical protein
VKGQGTPAAHEGDWAEATGRIGRSAGRLALMADSVRPVEAGIATQTPAWVALAQDAAAWDHRPLLLKGWVEKGELRDHDGHGVRLGAGSWPTGAATVRGYLSYDPGCLCHVLNGHAETPPLPAEKSVGERSA